MPASPDKKREIQARYRAKHKVVLAEKGTAYRKANPHVARNAANKYYAKNKVKILASRYGLPLCILEAMPDSCAICGSKDRLCVDHCHRTKSVRGILCNACNVALGLFQDSPEYLRAAMRYLTTHGENDETR